MHNAVASLSDQQIEEFEVNVATYTLCMYVVYTLRYRGEV